MCRKTAFFMSPSAAALSIMCTKAVSSVMRSTFTIVPIRAMGTEMATTARAPSQPQCPKRHQRTRKARIIRLRATCKDISNERHLNCGANNSSLNGIAQDNADQHTRDERFLDN